MKSKKLFSVGLLLILVSCVNANKPQETTISAVPYLTSTLTESPVYNLPSGWIFFETPTSVASVEIDSQDNLWIGFDDVIIKLDINNGNRETFYFDNMPNISDMIFDENGVVWIGSQYSTFQRYKEGQWGIQPARSPLFLSHDGSIWAGETDSSITRFNGTEWESYQINSDNDTTVISIAVSQDDEIWVSLMQRYWEGQEANKGVWRFDGKTWNAISELSEDGLHYRILPSPDGSLWFVAPKVVEGPEKPGRIKKIMDQKWIIDIENFLYTPILEIDPDGALWGSDILNLLKFDGSNWLILISKEDVEQWVGIRRFPFIISDIAFNDSGTMCVGTSEGVFCKVR